MQTIEEIGKIIFNDEYWKGGNNGNFKAPCNSGEPKPFNQAKQYRYICGVIQQHIVMTDYDNEEAFECRLKIAKEKKQNCIVIKSPNKGGHFYWFNRQQIPIKSNSGNKTVLTLSPVDYKAGIRKIVNTGEVKRARCAGSLSTESGELREVLYCSIKEDNTLDEIPFYDLPLNSGEKFNFINMGEGDGRQDGLFTYMNPVKGAGFSYEQFKEVAELIEQYVFSVPLEDEFENAVRQEAWDTLTVCNDSLFSKGTVFLFNKFGDYLMEKYHIKKINGYMHSYKDGVYIPGYEPIEKLMLDEIPSLTKTKRNEVLDYLRIRAEEKPTAELHLIPFKNGIYNLNTNQLEPFSPQHIITNKIPWNYNPDAKSDLVDSVLDKLSCGDADIRYALEEVAGACLYRSAAIGGGMAAILVGDKYNGKSTFIHMVESMLGKGNYSAVDAGDLGKRFITSMLYGMLANIGDDISNGYIGDTSILKKLITGEEVQAEEKGQKPFNFVSNAMHIYAANDIPHMKDPTGAVLRRLLLIPLNGKFTKETPDYDPFIKYKLGQAEHMEYFIQLALDGLADVLENKVFTVPTKAEQQKASFEVENNPVLAFIEDAGKESIVNEPTTEVYKRYQVFCADSGFNSPMAKIAFSKNINRILGTITKQKKISGINQQIYVEVEEK
jgi:putative DNA primase/helicase